jgi:hypothetical protein
MIYACWNVIGRCVPTKATMERIKLGLPTKALDGFSVAELNAGLRCSQQTGVFFRGESRIQHRNISAEQIPQTLIEICARARPPPPLPPPPPPLPPPPTPPPPPPPRSPDSDSSSSSDCLPLVTPRIDWATFGQSDSSSEEGDITPTELLDGEDTTPTPTMATTTTTTTATTTTTTTTTNVVTYFTRAAATAAKKAASIAMRLRSTKTGKG